MSLFWTSDVGRRVPPPDPPRPGLQGRDRPHADDLCGRRGVRPRRRRPDRRPHRERGGDLAGPCPRRRHRPGVARARSCPTARSAPPGSAGGPASSASRSSESRNQGDVYSYDLDSGQLQRWTTSDPGGVDPGKFAEPELIKAFSFDGRPIPAFLYRPTKPAAGGGRWPVLIDIHGGPGRAVPPRLSRPGQRPDRRAGRWP